MPSQKLAATILAAFLVCSAPGCAALARWIPVVVATISEAAQVLDSIEAVADEHYEASGLPLERIEFAKAMAKARLSLSAAARLAKGVDSASREDLDAAFEAFRLAYQDVLSIVGPLGLATPSLDGSMSAPAQGPLLVPSPGELVGAAKTELAR